MRIFFLVRACIHTGEAIVLARDAEEAIKLMNRKTGDDWVVLHEIKQDEPQALYYQ